MLYTNTITVIPLLYAVLGHTKFWSQKARIIAADNTGVDSRALTVLHMSWPYQILASKTADERGADNRGLTVSWRLPANTRV